jgi:hypothetical protein
MRASIANVMAFRVPLGLPGGLPDWPGLKGLPRCFLADFSATALARRWLVSDAVRPQSVEQSSPNIVRPRGAVYRQRYPVPSSETQVRESGSIGRSGLVDSSVTEDEHA